MTDMANGPMVNAHLPMEHPGNDRAALEKLGAPPPEAPGAGAPKTFGQKENGLRRNEIVEADSCRNLRAPVVYAQNARPRWWISN